MSRVLAIVPARSGSKGVPDKNTKPLAGRPLLEYTAAAALASGVLDRVILSTDSQAIADVGAHAGLEVPFMRPAALAQDDTPMLPVIQHAIGALERDGWHADFIVLLQPTSPLRQPGHIRGVVDVLRDTGADSVVTVVQLPLDQSPDYVMRMEDGVLRPFLPEGERVTRRQDARPAYRREGTAYAFRRATLDRFGNIYGDDCRPFLMDPAQSLSIDSHADWQEAERRLGART